MLRRRLTLPGLVALAVVVPSACGDESGGAIEDNVVRPGVTALQNAENVTCAVNRDALLDAIDLYEVLNAGESPADEAALVEAELLRAETSDWDIVDGELVAENPACGEP